MSSFFALLVVYISFYVIRFENIPASENGPLLIIPHFSELFATLAGHIYFQENNMDTDVIRLVMVGVFYTLPIKNGYLICSVGNSIAL